MFAFVRDDPSEWLSAARPVGTPRPFPEVGGAFVTQYHRPILTLLADTSPGVHDMLYPPCSPALYRGPASRVTTRAVARTSSSPA